MARPLAWAFTNIEQPLTSGLRVTNNLLAASPESDTITAARLLIHLTLKPSLGSQIVGHQKVTMGIGVAAIEAFAVANSVGIPNSAVSGEVPARGWLWSDVLEVYHDEGGANVDFVWEFGELRADARASRKVDRGVLYFTMSSTVVQGAGQTINLTGRVAVLCMT